MTTTLTTRKGTFLFVGVPEDIYSLPPDLTGECIGKLSTLTEDQAREVVGLKANLYPDFMNEKQVCVTAKESLRSLMQAERLYTSNIYTQPDADSSREHTDAYNEMQSRTFPDWLIIKIK